MSLAVGPFLLDAPVATGSTAVVWRAVVAASGLPVAVKVLRTDAPPPLRLAFREEARALAALDHPNVVRVVAAGDLPDDAPPPLPAGAPYVAVEWMDGGMLADRPPASFDELRALLDALLSALAHAHARGIVHRDLKPSNVLFSGDVPKIADFGVARRMDDARSGPSAGTPDFAAPEQLAGRGRDEGPATDLYALGAVAWALVTGRAPFASADVAATIRATLRHGPPRLAARYAVPEGFEDWARRLLDKSPWRRFACAADARAALSAVAAGRVGRKPDESLTWGGLDVPVAVFDLPEPPDDWREPARTSSPSAVGPGLVGARTVPFVGRETERDALWTALRRVRDGGSSTSAGSRLGSPGPRAIVLSGSAGVGKTRLAAWLAERAEETGAALSLTAVHGGPRTGARDGVSGMLARWAQAFGLPRAELPAHLAPRLRALGVGDAVEVDAVAELVCPAEADQRALVRFARPEERRAAVRRLLGRLSAARPVVVVLDDVQWGLDAVRVAAEVLEDPRQRVLFVLTVRDDLVRPDVRAALDALPAERLTLGPLPPADHTRLVAHLGLPSAQADRVVARSAGNALLALQVAAASSGATTLPGDLDAAWSDRLDRALAGRPAMDGIALEIAAALGTVVDRDEWAEACKYAGARPSADLVDRLVDLHLLRPDAGGFAFVHASAREACEARAAAVGRWSTHHWACAAVLEGRKDLASRERRARHLAASGAKSGAIRALYDVATERIVQGDWDGAAVLLDEREPLLGASGHAAAEQAHGRGRVARGKGRNEEALAFLDRAIALAADDTAGKTLAGWAWVDRGSILQTLGRMDEADASNLRGLAVFEEVGDAQLVGFALGRLATADLYRGRLDDCEARIERLWSMTSLLPRMTTQLLGLHAGLLVRRGDLDGAIARYREALAKVRDGGSRWHVADLANSLGDALRQKGDYAAAEASYRETVEIGRAIGWGMTVYAEVNLAVVLVEQRRWADASAILEEVLPRAEQSGLRMLVAGIHGTLVAVRAATARWDDFDRELATTCDAIAATRFVDVDLARMTMLGAALARDAGHRGRAVAALKFASDQWKALGREAEEQVCERAIASLS